jgi:hypothetical protein
MFPYEMSEKGFSFFSDDCYNFVHKYLNDRITTELAPMPPNLLSLHLDIVDIQTEKNYAKDCDTFYDPWLIKFFTGSYTE